MELIQLEKVAILLDNDKTIYQSGQTISGTVIIALNGELELSKVNITLRSMSEVDWVEIYGNVAATDRDSDQLLDVVYDTGNSICETKITKGEHRIPFEFCLPDNIPSSLETRHGFIKYWIEVIISNDSLYKEVYSERKYFCVETPFIHGLQLSIGGGIEKELGILNLGSGKVRIDAIIRKKGHIPGETVEVHCLVTNTSTVAVTPRASFIQTQIFMAKERHNILGYTSDLVFGEQVNAGQTREQTIKVHIPNEIPLTIKTRLISIKYFIHVTLDIPHAIDLHLNLPIIISNEFALDDRIASFL